jgi:hypothetical protein
MIDNPNPSNFYSKKEMLDRQKYIPVIKEKFLKNLEDLKNKIINEEPFPHGNIDLEILCEFDDTIQELLNNWHY